MGKIFTVKMDHKNLIYFFDSEVGEFYLQSSFFHHIPGVQNVIADGLNRVISLSSVEIPASKRHMFVEDPYLSHFPVRRGRNRMVIENPGDFEGEDEEGALGLEDLGVFSINMVSLQDIIFISLVILALLRS